MEFKDSSSTTVPLPKGEQIHWRVSGYAIIKDKQNHILMIRSRNNLWHFPGGGVEDNENIFACIQRECLEETGYKVHMIPELQHFNEQFFYHRGEEKFYHSLQLFFLANLTESASYAQYITEHDATKECAWINLTTLKLDDVHETVRELVEKLQR